MWLKRSISDNPVNILLRKSRTCKVFNPFISDGNAVNLLLHNKVHTKHSIVQFLDGNAVYLFAKQAYPKSPISDSDGNAVN